MFLVQGDTGNPAVHFSGMNRAGTLFGIALFSGTEECISKSKPGVFAKVVLDLKASSGYKYTARQQPTLTQSKLFILI